MEKPQPLTDEELEQVVGGAEALPIILSIAPLLIQLWQALFGGVAKGVGRLLGFR